MSAESDLVLTVTKRLTESHDGVHPESVHVKAEMARMFLEAQDIIAELRRRDARKESKIAEMEHILKAVGAV